MQCRCGSRWPGWCRDHALSVPGSIDLRVVRAVADKLPSAFAAHAVTVATERSSHHDKTLAGRPGCQDANGNVLVPASPLSPPAVRYIVMLCRVSQCRHVDRPPREFFYSFRRPNSFRHVAIWVKKMEIRYPLGFEVLDEWVAILHHFVPS